MSATLTVASYAVLALVALVLEVSARRPGARHPTFGALMTWAMRRRSTQWLVAVVWWWLGWHWMTGR